jgi:hypothetical protein
VRKAADESMSATSLQATTGLDLPLAANTTYTFSYYILFQSSGATNGIGLALSGPAGGTIALTAEIPTGSAGTSAMWTGFANAYDTAVLSTNTPTAATTYVAHIYGVVANGATAGNLTVKYRSEIGSGTVTIKANSWGALEVG